MIAIAESLIDTIIAACETKQGQEALVRLRDATVAFQSSKDGKRLLNGGCNEFAQLFDAIVQALHEAESDMSDSALSRMGVRRETSRIRAELERLSTPTRQR